MLEELLFNVTGLTWWELRFAIGAILPYALVWFGIAAVLGLLRWVFRQPGALERQERAKREAARRKRATREAMAAMRERSDRER